MGKEGPSPPVALANVKGEAEQSGPSHPIGRKREPNGAANPTIQPGLHQSIFYHLLFSYKSSSLYSLKSSSSSEPRREKEVTGFRTCPIRQGRKRIALDSVFFLLVLLFCHGSAMRVMSCERGSSESGGRVYVRAVWEGEGGWGRESSQFPLRKLPKGARGKEGAPNLERKINTLFDSKFTYPSLA